MRKLPLSVALASVIPLSIAAVSLNAQEVMSFEKVDSDGDGQLSSREAEQALPEVIADTNDDGFINRREVTSVLPEVEFHGADESAIVGRDDYREMLGELHQGEENPQGSDSTDPGGVQSRPDRDDRDVLPQD